MSSPINLPGSSMQARGSFSPLISDEQYYVLNLAYNQWDRGNHPVALPGFWIPGNMSTMQNCTVYDGSVVLLKENRDLPFDNYFCRAPNRTNSLYASFRILFDKSKLEYAQVGGTTTSSGEHRARIATAGLFIVTALLTIAIAAAAV